MNYNTWVEYKGPGQGHCSYIYHLEKLFTIHYFVVLAYTASTAPRELMVEGASQTSLTVSWRAPEFPNGVISQYMVSSRIIH